MAKKLSKFESAFAAARKGGAKEFSFGGKSYNTKLASSAGATKMKGEGASKKKSSLPQTAPTPTSRSSAISGMAKKDPSFSSLSNVAKTAKPSNTAKASVKSKPFMKDTETLNAFKQKESRRSADSSTKNIVGSSLRAAGNSVLKKKYK